MSVSHDFLTMTQCRNAHQHVYDENNLDFYQDNQRKHYSLWTQEFIGGAIAFQGLKVYEDYLRRTGEKISHYMMKQMVIAFAIDEIDKLFQTIELHFIDQQKTKHRTIEQIHYLIDQQYRLPTTFYQTFNYQQQKQDKHNHYH